MDMELESSCFGTEGSKMEGGLIKILGRATLKLTEYKGNKGQSLSLAFYFSFMLRILKSVRQCFVITENYKLEMKPTYTA